MIMMPTNTWQPSRSPAKALGRQDDSRREYWKYIFVNIECWRRPLLTLITCQLYHNNNVSSIISIITDKKSYLPPCPAFYTWPKCKNCVLYFIHTFSTQVKNVKRNKIFWEGNTSLNGIFFNRNRTLKDDFKIRKF